MNKNDRAAFGWLIIAVIVIVFITYYTVGFIASWLGSSDSVGTRAFGAISIVVIIGLSIFIVIKLLGNNDISK